VFLKGIPKPQAAVTQNLVVSIALVLGGRCRRAIFASIS
jgi:hypothetical protein